MIEAERKFMDAVWELRVRMAFSWYGMPGHKVEAIGVYSRDFYASSGAFNAFTYTESTG